MSHLEKGKIRLRDGYPALSEWIARDPDHETFIFRRFDRLTARNLLNLQSQLLEIEQKLDDLDQKSRTQIHVGIRCWELLLDDQIGSDEIQEHNESHLELYRDLEEKLETYRMCAKMFASVRDPTHPYFCQRTHCFGKHN